MSIVQPATRGTVKGTRRPRIAPATRSTPPRAPGHVLRVINRAGDARELDSDPVDHDKAVRRAERMARLVGRLVAPKLARGAVVVVVAIDTRAEVERFLVKVPKRKRPVAESAAPAALIPTAIGDRTARYAILQNSVTNRLGWEVIELAQHLLDKLNELETKGYAHLYRDFLQARLNPEPEADMGNPAADWNASYFDQVAADATGFTWSLETFIRLIECGLVTQPTKGTQS